MAVARVNQVLNDPIESAMLALQGNAVSRIDLTGGKAFVVEDEDVIQLLLSDVWKRNTSVTELSLSINHVTDDGAKAIAAALAGHGGALSSLEVDRNRIGDEGAISLIRALPATIRRLDLSGNDITDATVKAFVEYMESGECKCRDLHTLVLRDCPRLTDAALETLCWWLAEQQPALVSLTVSGNDFTDAAIPPLKIALQSNITLQDLNISNTKMTDFSPLAEAFDKNETLIALTMGSNGKRVTIPKIDAALRLNKRRQAERRNEIALLKERHAQELKALKSEHLREVQRLRETIEELRGEITALKSPSPGL